MLTNHDIEHLDDIIAGQYGDWFTAKLLRLIKHADQSNRSLLRMSFPEEVTAVESWERYGGDVSKVRQILGR